MQNEEITKRLNRINEQMLILRGIIRARWETDEIMAKELDNIGCITESNCKQIKSIILK